ncbi:DUF3703 domain-containing protein [Noviherbaspirillum humi]|uniref:DUF3703 domain-containing protein n=1 Tax=Noviherbaspirillum humi TaxID=1688639 RepID=UPI00159592B6|nr:DUF3703 domain-containing protein [Noviherbaspirillum humi]
MENAFESEMAAAYMLAASGRLGLAMRHLERAHVLGQRRVGLHIRSHWAMLKIALRRRAMSDAFGQALRIILGALGSAAGVVPTGNTGGSDIGMFVRLPVDPELAALIEHRR